VTKKQLENLGPSDPTRDFYIASDTREVREVRGELRGFLSEHSEILEIERTFTVSMLSEKSEKSK